MALEDVYCDGTPVARGGRDNTLQLKYIPARILWPALGCPELVDPNASPDKDDHTGCIHLLIVARTKNLTANDVARHLHWVKWEERRTRFLDKCDRAFPPAQIAVKLVEFYRGNDKNETDLTYLIRFAGSRIEVSLSRDVLAFYESVWKDGAYLHEITISRDASKSLPTGLYNLFWINPDRNDTANDPSAEMELLLEKFVKPRLAKQFPRSSWATSQIPYYASSDEMAIDYEYEWNLHPAKPGQAPASIVPVRSPTKRVEVLHPLFVGPTPSRGDWLTAAHITDTHVDIRMDLFEHRSRFAPPVKELDYYGYHSTDPLLPRDRWPAFNNPNRRFEEIYKKAQDSTDVLLMTGDLVDYGRGHIGSPDAELGELGHYWLDRNWFLFYKLLASGTLYTKPVYTCLGNHDWRLNPYPPAGTFFDTSSVFNVTKKELVRIHGKNADKAIYTKSWTDWPKAIIDWGLTEDQRKLMPTTSMPLVTTTESVIWYLMLINPFLDCSVRIPGGFSLLMLDWGRNEETVKIDLPSFDRHTPDPVAEDSLTWVQISMIKKFVKQKVKAKIIGIHAPLVAPSNAWPSEELYTGWVTDPKKKERFPVIAMGNVKEIWTPFPPNRLAAYGSIKLHRNETLQLLRDNKVPLVLAGHVHRRGMYMMVNPAKAQADSNLRHGMLLRLPNDLEINDMWFTHGPPLFVNTTSAGPVGGDPQKVHGQNDLVTPGWSEILIANDGRVLSVKERYGAWSPYKSRNYGDIEAVSAVAS